MHIPNFQIDVNGYAFKGFIYRCDDADAKTSWAGTLLAEGTRIARISFDAATDDYEIDPISDSAYQLFVEFAEAWASEACADLSDPDDAPLSLLSHLADLAYHARRLEVISRRHTTFQLTTDPPHRFRYIRSKPITLDLVARLRATYGDKIACILREDEVRPMRTHSSAA